MFVELSNVPISLDAMLPENVRAFRREVAHGAGVKAERLGTIEVLRRSVDARKKSNVHFVLTLKVEIISEKGETSSNLEALRLHPAKGVNAKPYEPPEPFLIPNAVEAFEAVGEERPLVVGAGPAGLFAALYLARAGLRPILIERGQAVEERLRSVQTFSKGGPLNTESNIQFGEGGAGTFSDGKLTTGTKSPHIRHVLEEFVAAGAPQDILIDAKPHIGTDYLVTVVRGLREAIEEAGGEVRFSTKLVGLDLGPTEGDTSLSPRLSRMVKTAHLEDLSTGERLVLPVSRVIVALGHSARDTIQMLHAQDITLKRKPFAVGVRIEHPQALINRLQYGTFAGHPALPPADYKLAVKTEEGRGVYTFCMCPGGQVVAAASEEGGVCVNGMSDHARDGANANSALLVEVKPEDFKGDDVLAGMHFQRALEQAAYEAGTNATNVPYTAPIQSLGSFLETSGQKNGASHPGASQGVMATYPRPTAEIDLHTVLPSHISEALAEGVVKMGRKMPGFDDPAAQLTAVEARSSSPVQMTRDRITFQAEGIQGLYPAGEGAGYAGGIMSAATDGIRVAQVIVEDILHEAELREALQALAQGGTVAFPTDTVCGIAVSSRDAASPLPLYELKDRDSSKPIAWLVSSVDDLQRFGKNVPAYAVKLAEEGWPGPLTLVVEASDAVPEAFRSVQGTIGLRMPDSVDTLELIKRHGAPLATTSANRSGRRAPVSVEDIDPTLLQAVDAVVLRASGSKHLAQEDRRPSQVIDCTTDTPRTLRS